MIFVIDTVRLLAAFGLTIALCACVTSQPSGQEEDLPLVIEPDWQERLVQKAKELNLKNVQVFENGVYGKYGSSVAFFTTIEQAPTQGRLYWVMVKVLSRKYGCFMVDKEDYKAATKFVCRDGRTIIYRYGKRNSLRYFFARQFDEQGREIIIRALSE